ncbi:hypothetical protein ACFQZE_24450 [Paenibacillus sp. GCM10027627]|uniref:hypothetical protein n=1 Tax=unclassified Paenibacillus TaxID=185978 RepID=UPI0036340FEB
MDNTVGGLVGKATGWIDKIFEFFGLYTSKYSKYLVYALMIWVASKMLKVNLKLDTGKGK